MSPGLNSKTLYVEQRVRQISSKEFAAYLHLVKFSQNDYGNMDTTINKFHSLERKMIPVWNHFPMHYCSFKMPGAKIDGKKTLSLDRISNIFRLHAFSYQQHLFSNNYHYCILPWQKSHVQNLLPKNYRFSRRAI